MNPVKYREEFCDLLVEHMKMGKSYDSFPSRIYDHCKMYVGLTTMYDWEKKYPEWKNAKAIAVSKALDFYETRASVKVSGQTVKGIDAKLIDSYVLMGMLKTRFYKIYGDKQRIEHDIDEETKEQLKLCYKLGPLDGK